MMDIEDKIFWLKFNRLDQVFEAMYWAAMRITAYSDNQSRLDGVQEPFKGPDAKIRIEFCKEICINVLREYLLDYHNGSFYTIKSSLAYLLQGPGYDANKLSTTHDAIATHLEVIYDIARLHFKIFDDLKYNEVEEGEGLNYANFIIAPFDLPDELTQIYNNLSDEEKEEDKGLKLAELIEKSKLAVEEYDPKFNYPEENEDAELYLERIS